MFNKYRSQDKSIKKNILDFVTVDGDTLAGFDLSKYDIGDEFEVVIWGKVLWKFKLTKELKSKLILSLFNKYPFICVASVYHEYYLRCVNRNFDKPTRAYYLYCSSKINHIMRSQWNMTYECFDSDLRIYYIDGIIRISSRDPNRTFPVIQSLD